jgi:UDP-glucose 4-epimerase
MSGSVLVTGGAGYIGSVVVEQLLSRGYTVVVLDDLSRGHREAVAPDATFVQGGIGDRVVLDALLRRHRCDALVHLAAYALVGESVAQPEMYRANNVTAGRMLLEGAAAAGIRRVVFSSSCAVYGHPRATPISEDTPLAPVNPYGETKREFERLLADYASQDGAAVFSLRYFNAAGATAHHGEDHAPETHLIPNVLRVASGGQLVLEIQGTDYPTPDGTAVRDYVHVLDIADAHVRALEADLADAGPRGRATAVNLGTGVGYSVLAVAEAARRITGRPIPAVARPRRPGDPPELVAAAGRADAVLGWRPRHSGLEAILASAWAWHQAHPHGYGN